jgi:hypothetical protein
MSKSPNASPTYVGMERDLLELGRATSMFMNVANRFWLSAELDSRLPPWLSQLVGDARTNAGRIAQHWTDRGMRRCAKQLAKAIDAL